MNELTNLIFEFNEARNWRKYHDPRSLVLAICSEAGELAHLFRWRRRSARNLSAEAKSAVEGEIADIFIFLLSLCIELKVDPENVIRKKLEENNIRFQSNGRGK